MERSIATSKFWKSRKIMQREDVTDALIVECRRGPFLKGSMLIRERVSAMTLFAEGTAVAIVSI